MPKNVAVLWDEEVEIQGDTPFRKEHVDTTYEYISSLAEEKGMRLFITRYDRYNEGVLEKAFRFTGEKWVEEKEIEVDAVFDKYRFDDETVSLKKEIEEKRPVLNSFEVEKICKDKLLAYEKFPENHPETREATKENVREMLEEYGKVVVKPLAAHAGEEVKVLEEISEFDHSEDEIVQRFIESGDGIDKLGIDGVHDLRVVVVDGEPVISYIRQPKSGYIANVSQGGSIEFVDLEKIPEEAMAIVDQVVDVFREYDSFVCGVDMIFDKEQNPWILELNSKPGMSFYEDKELKEQKKPYIKAVVDSLDNLA